MGQACWIAGDHHYAQLFLNLRLHSGLSGHAPPPGPIVTDAFDPFRKCNEVAGQCSVNSYFTSHFRDRLQGDDHHCCADHLAGVCFFHAGKAINRRSSKKSWRHQPPRDCGTMVPGTGWLRAA